MFKAMNLLLLLPLSALLQSDATLSPSAGISQVTALISPINPQGNSLTTPLASTATNLDRPIRTVSSTYSGSSAVTPLVSKCFNYPSGIPYKVDTYDNLPRGPQTGFNVCNSTTQNQDSLCQTSFVNSINDFCIWGPIDPDSTVANTEGQMVAWCTDPKHGTRLIPRNSLTGVQFMRTPDYVQVVGYIDQSRINLQSDDYASAEMDPYGPDLRGDPIGGLMYSNAWSSNDDTYIQVIQWQGFIGKNYFCVKVCDPAGPNAADFCSHDYDRMGCFYNAPSNAQDGDFESCLGDNQEYTGVYTEEDSGMTLTFSQPPDSIHHFTVPYTPYVPASSKCTAYASSAIYQALETVTAAGDPDFTSTSERSPSPTSTPNQTPAEPPSDPGLGSDGASTKISVPTLIGFLVACFVFWYVYRRSKTNNVGNTERAGPSLQAASAG